MNIKELKQAIAEGKTLVWNDPDPIEGNDYTVTFIEDLNVPAYEHFTQIDWNDVPVLIHYGDGSEAEVLISELERVYFIGYVGTDGELTEFKDSDDADFTSEEWVKLTASNWEDAKDKYLDAFKEWQDKQSDGLLYGGLTSVQVTVTLQIDVKSKDLNDIYDAIGEVNKALTEANLNCEPQIFTSGLDSSDIN